MQTIREAILKGKTCSHPDSRSNIAVNNHSVVASNLSSAAISNLNHRGLHHRESRLAGDAAAGDSVEEADTAVEVVVADIAAVAVVTEAVEGTNQNNTEV